jgi:hypothetical protein
MKFPAALLLLAALCLTGCATMSRSDRAVLTQHGVEQPLFGRMVYNDRLTPKQIIEVSRKGVPSDFLIRYLRFTEAVYTFTPHDRVRLRKAGVKPAVIEYLRQTPALFPAQYDAVVGGYNPDWDEGYGGVTLVKRHSD